MRDKKNKQNRLNFEKFQITKIKTPEFIVGGTGIDDEEEAPCSLIRTTRTMTTG